MWYLNAYQSHFFNDILARRLDRLDRILVGDWAMKMENGACFLVDAWAVECTKPAVWIGTIEGHRFRSTSLIIRHLLRRQRIAFQRHALLHVGRIDPPKRFAPIQVLRRKSRRSRITGCRHAFVRVDPITTLGLFGPWQARQLFSSTGAMSRLKLIGSAVATAGEISKLRSAIKRNGMLCSRVGQAFLPANQDTQADKDVCPTT